MSIAELHDAVEFLGPGVDKPKPRQRHIVGIGHPVEYLGMQWTVQTITKQHVVLVAVGNPSRTTRVALSVFEKVV